MDPPDRARAYQRLDQHQAAALEPEVQQRMVALVTEVESLLAALRRHGVHEPGTMVAGVVAGAILSDDRQARTG